MGIVVITDYSERTEHVCLEIFSCAENTDLPLELKVISFGTQPN